MHFISILALMEPIACEARTTKGESRTWFIRKANGVLLKKKTQLSSGLLHYF